MQFPVKIDSLLKPDSEGFVCCSGKDFISVFRTHQQKQASKLFESIVENLGAASAKAQALKQIITSAIKFNGSDHRIYIKVKQNAALGFVKVGEKNLFYRDFMGNIKEMKPTCILDIYVHESCQRSGIGKEIFEKFLRCEGKTPQKLAYDRPSEKLIGFLKKHYGLAKFIPQNNNFVIFDRYFTKEPPIFQPSLQKPLKTEPISNNLRPRSMLTSKKQQQPPIHKPKQAPETNYPSSELPSNTFYQPQLPHRHKNNQSEGFSLSIPSQSNPMFNTTSNVYGGHYHYRNKK